MPLARDQPPAQYAVILLTQRAMDVTTLADGAFGFACNKLALSPTVWCRATIWWRPNAANEHEPIRAVPFLPWGGAVSKITGTREHDHQLIQTTQQP